MAFYAYYDNEQIVSVVESNNSPLTALPISKEAFIAFGGVPKKNLSDENELLKAKISELETVVDTLMEGLV